MASFKCENCGHEWEQSYNSKEDKETRNKLIGMVGGAVVGFMVGGPLGICAGALTGAKGGRFVNAMSDIESDHRPVCPKCRKQVKV